MLAPTECLVWDGITFRPRPAEHIMLPEGARLVPGKHPPAKVGQAALGRYAQAMNVNPNISVYLGAGLEMFGYPVGGGPELYRTMLEYQPDFASAYAPSFHLRKCLGMCFWDAGFRQKIYVKTNQKSVLSTLFHELFHSIYKHIPGERKVSLEEFGNVIRDRNGKVDTIDPDVKSASWLDQDEEAEALAFEHFATGRPMPFGLALPSPVRATFDAALRGDYANHRAVR